MDAETGFLIDGKVYEVPTLDSLTLDESELLYERCGIVQEDFVHEEGETEDEHEERLAKLMRHPGFMGSLVQIAYQRGNPHAKQAQVQSVMRATNRLDAFSTLPKLKDKEKDPDVPLASTSEPGEPSSSGSLASESSTGDSSASSGIDSTNGSEGRARDLARIGPTRLATSSTSGQKESAVSGYPI